MSTELNAKEVLHKITAAEFKKNNGIVMRAVSVAFPLRWFEYEELRTVVSGRVEKQELQKAVTYLADEGYLKYRHNNGAETIDILDYEINELEFRVAPKGTRLIECVEQNELIEM